MIKKISYVLLAFLLIGCSNKIDDSIEQVTKVQTEIDVKMYTKLWNDFLAGDTDVINDKNFTKDCIVVTANGNIVGIEATKKFYMNYITAFSEIEFKIVDTFGQGNKLIKHYNFKGKHVGEFFGLPATGNYLNLSGTTVITMRDGKIAKEHDFFDMQSLLNQLKKGKGDVNVDEYKSIN